MSHAVYLLDTNVVSDVVRGRAEVVARLRATPSSEVVISSITQMELEYGMALSPAAALRHRPVIRAILDAAEVAPFTTEDAKAAARVRATLRRLGTPIGPYDVLLAGVALSRRLVMVTANVDELSRVEGLRVESWR